jgi:L-lactate permease
LVLKPRVKADAANAMTGIDPFLLGAMVGRQLPFFSLIVPFWVVWAFAGYRGVKATNWYGHEGTILRFVFKHSIVLACLVGILIILQAYVFTGMIVTPP